MDGADVVVGGHSFGGRVAESRRGRARRPVRGRSCCSATRSTRQAAPERAAARIEHWPRIRCPVLLLSGESDPFARIGLLGDGVRKLALTPSSSRIRSWGIRSSRSSTTRSIASLPSCTACPAPDNRTNPHSVELPGAADVAILRPPQLDVLVRPQRGPANPAGSARSARRPLPARETFHHRCAQHTGGRGRSRIATPKPSRCRGHRRPRWRPSCSRRSRRPADTQAHAKGIDRFLYALSRVESGGNYRARNHSSGAYGRYQIMPANWAGWARRWVGNGSAHQSPRNQETVARGKIHALYHWLGSWRRVAYWWLTGSSKTSGWSAYASRYVRNVMAIYNGTRIVESRGDIHRYSEKSRAIDYRGTWERAKHRLLPAVTAPARRSARARRRPSASRAARSPGTDRTGRRAARRRCTSTAST